MSERLQNTCSWSSSRESTFRECKKKYWYTYYGAWEGWPLYFRDPRSHVSPLAAYLYRLKNMQPVSMFVGSLVHKVIEESVPSLIQTKKLPPKSALLEKGKTLLSKGLEESSSKAWLTHPKKHTNLLEDYYQHHKPSYEELEHKVTTCLSNWYDSPLTQGMLLHPNTTFGDVEKLMQFSLGADMQCIVVFDLYVHWKREEKDEKLLIFDWKTGSESDRIMKQMAAYALAAIHLLRVPLSSIIVCPFYLMDSPTAYKKIGAGSPHPLSEKDIEETKRSISSALQEMKELHVEGRLPDPTRFPYVEERRQCRFCPFQELCEKASFQEKNPSELELMCIHSQEITK